MFKFIQIIIYFIIYNIVFALDQHIYIITTNELTEETLVKPAERNVYFLDDKVIRKKEKVNIQLYYECLCPDCIEFDTKIFRPVVLKLNRYLNIQTYPYGNAKTFERDGKYEFQCQHGPKECYGNKLHACAILLIRNMTKAILFNSCMMTSTQEGRGSDDKAADMCGNSENVNVTAIKECAKGDRGDQLLKYYGDESKKANFKYVPYILIDGQLNDGSNFMHDVCAAFSHPPLPCLS